MDQGKSEAFNRKARYVLGFSAGRLRPWLPSAALLPVCGYVLFSRGEVVGLDLLTLLVHEAGHLCFFFLGDFLYAAGGSIMQVLLPAVLVWHFWQHGIRTGVQVSLLWLGQSALNVGIYAADARLQELPLLVGRKHDWFHLLQQAGLLEYDLAFAYVFCFVAMLSFLALLALPLWSGGEERVWEHAF